MRNFCTTLPTVFLCLVLWASPASAQNIFRCVTPAKVASMLGFYHPDMEIVTMTEIELQSFKEHVAIDITDATKAMWHAIPDTNLVLVHVFRNGCRVNVGRMGVGRLLEYLGVSGA